MTSEAIHSYAPVAIAKLLQSGLTLCNPIIVCLAPLSMGFSWEEY